jgi:hypothetical protein
MSGFDSIVEIGWVDSLLDKCSTLWNAPWKATRILLGYHFQKLDKDKSSTNVSRTHMNVHPQHMKVMKHTCVSH